MENSHFRFFLSFDFSKIFGFSKGLASNAQVNPDIEKCKLFGNGTKNLFGGI